MIKVKVKLNKKLKLRLPSNAALVKEVGERAATMIEKRIRTRGVDGDGKRLPPLSTGTFVVSANDSRWQGTRLEPRYPKGSKGFKEPTLLVDRDGYRSAKRAKGAKGKRDGALTGAMWRGVTAQIKRKKGEGAFIRIFFSGSQTVGTSKIEKTKTGKPKKIKVTNTLKARMIQFKGGRQMFTLMSLTPTELNILAGIIARKIKLIE